MNKPSELKLSESKLIIHLNNDLRDVAVWIMLVLLIVPPCY